MVKTLKLRRAGESVSARLSKSMLERLNLAAGDQVLAIETEKGILLTPYNPKVEHARKIAPDVHTR